MQALGWLLKQFYRTKHLELKYYSVSWNCTNINAVMLLKVCILAIGSYLPRKVAGYFENREQYMRVKFLSAGCFCYCKPSDLI